MPRAYYAPFYDGGRSRYDDRYVDPLARKTAEQLRRSPKPPPAKGPLLISVSLAHQHLTLYDNGVAIAQSPISSGNASYPTPTGVFSVIQKQRWHRSNLYSDAPMPFMQRITWSGVALHAGQLPGYPASHGCIRLPDDFAVRLFRTTSIGARVVISQHDIVPVEISHPRLFTLPPPLPAETPVAEGKAGETEAAPATPAAAVEGAAKSETKVASTEPVAPQGALADKALRPGPVSVFVSRKEQRIYVRKGFEPLLDMPVTIQNPDQPIGTHLFLAMASKDGGLRPTWMVVSPPSRESGVVNRREQHASSKRKGRKAEPAPLVTPAPQSPAAAAAALDRIEFPAEAVTRITELMSVGAALTISDEGLGPETGKETDFVVVTSPIQPTRRAKSERYERSYYRYDRYDRYEPERYWTGRRWF